MRPGGALLQWIPLALGILILMAFFSCRSVLYVQPNRISAAGAKSENGSGSADLKVGNKDQYVKCILNGNQTQNFWALFVNTISQCSERYTSLDKSLFTLHVGRYNETKRFIEYANKTASQRCRSLTIGIGGDYKVETELLARYPKCRLYGLEPKQTEGWEFVKYGTYIPYGLTKDGGLLNLTVRKPSGDYGVESVPTLNVDQMMRYYIGSDPIHFATLDIEGGEYSLLKEFHDGGAFSQNQLHICQMDVEFHGPLEAMRISNSTLFYTFFKELLSKTSYVPVAPKIHLKVHRKVTLLDTKHPFCQETFGIDRLLIK